MAKKSWPKVLSMKPFSQQNPTKMLKESYRAIIKRLSAQGQKKNRTSYMFVLDVPRFHHKLSPQVFSEAGFTWPGEALTKHQSQVWVRRRWQSFRLSLQNGGQREGHSHDSSDHRKCLAAACTGVTPAPHLCPAAAVRCCLRQRDLDSVLSCCSVNFPTVQQCCQTSSTPLVLISHWAHDSVIHTSGMIFCLGRVRRAPGFSPTSNAHHEELQHFWQLQATHPVLK